MIAAPINPPRLAAPLNRPRLGRFALCFRRFVGVLVHARYLEATAVRRSVLGPSHIVAGRIMQLDE